ncbi:MAG: hypothetical protein LBK94_11265, partial [Prevotellaceae bacterium]|nr:hypothetical protein [Prevotellaceae bacterium]
MTEKIIESLGIKEVEAAIKSMTEQLETAETQLVSYADNVSATLKKVISALKEVKKAANFTELNATTQKTIEQTKEYEAALKAQAQQQKTIETLKARLIALENKEAVEIQKTRLEIAEKQRWQKAEAQAQIIAEKDVKALIEAYKNQSGSIRELTLRNKELRDIRDSLDTAAQAAEIQELNKIIDANTATIKANEDSYVRQKMTIGDYKTAIEGVKVQIGDAQALMVKIAKETGEGSKEYAAAAQSLVKLNAELDTYSEGLAEAEKDASPLKTRLGELRNQMQQLNSIGRNKWTEEQRAEYQKLATEAAKLNKTIKDTTTEIDILSHNNLTLNSIIDALKLVTSAFGVWKGTMASLGMETEEFEKVLLKLQGAMVVINGLQQISETLRAKSIIMVKLQTLAESKNTAVKWTAVNAQRALNLAQKAMPYVAVATGLFLIGKALFDFASKTDDAARKKKILNEIQKEGIKIAQDEVGKFTQLANTATLFSKNNKERLDAIKQINEQYGDYLPKLLTEKSTVEEITAAYEALVPVLQKQAVIRASMDKLNEKSKERIDFAMKEAEAIKKVEKAQEDYNEFKRLSDFSDLSEMFGGSAEMAANLRQQLKRAEKDLKNANDDLTETRTKNSKKIQKIEKDEQVILDGTKLVIQQLTGLFTGLGAAQDDQLTQQKALLNLQYKFQDINVTLIKSEEDRAKKQLEISKNRSVAELNEQKTALQKSVMNEEEKAKQIAAIDDIIAATQKKYLFDVSEMEKKYAYQTAVSVINTRLLLAKTGSKEELEARKDLINEQLKYELSLLPAGHAKRAELEAKAKKDTEKSERDFQKNLNDIDITNAENRLETAKKGSQKEYEERMTVLAKQRENELLAAEETGADRQAIIDKYAKAEKDAFEGLLAGRIEAETNNAAARLRIIEDMQREEEQALLGRYKNGEINEKQYNEQLAEIQHKYSVMAAEDAIANLERILDKEKLSDEQRADLVKQLADKQKALSDEQTAHTISNIEKENAKRKKSAELAKEYAQQAFETTMEFLTQISEAKIEAFDEELERIEAWKEAELARLDESVMSEETRAAEEKRIEDEAEAQRKKVEEEKRQEQAKQFRYQQLQSVAQT